MKKKLSDYSHQELLNLTPQELSELFNSERNSNNTNNVILFSTEYYNFTFDQKVKYWSGHMHRQMRWQEESGLDPYSIYSLEWYNENISLEPDFEAIMEKVITKYWGVGAGWSKREYSRRILRSKET